MNCGNYESLDDVFISKYYAIKITSIPLMAVLQLTGGEPLLQVKFLIELFTKLKS